MSANVRLIPLVCTRCQTAIPAGIDEVAWVCPQCGQGLLLSDEQGVEPLAMHCAAGIAAGKPARPFWVARGRVTTQRQVYGGGDQSRQAAEFWGQPRDFFVPAFECALEEMVAMGAEMVQRPPALTEGAAVPFAPVTVSPQDVQPMAEFIVMGVEAARKDKLREIRMFVELDPPVLWILP